MTAPTLTPQQIRRLRIQVSKKVAFVALGFGGAATLALLPLALFSGPPVLQPLGVLYAILYAAFVLAPSGLPLILLMVDSLLILINRPPLFLSSVLTAFFQRPQPVRRTLERMQIIGLVSVTMSPLTGFTISLLVAAGRLRPRAFVQVWEEARRRAATQTVSEPLVGANARLMGPVLRPVARYEEALQPC